MWIVKSEKTACAVICTYIVLLIGKLAENASMNLFSLFGITILNLGMMHHAHYLHFQSKFPKSCFLL